MVVFTNSEKLEVFQEPVFDRSLVSLHEHTYKPYGSPSFGPADIIYIPINFQDLILDVSDSYIYVEGTFTPDDMSKVCAFSTNAFAFLFDEVRYLMGGEQIVVARNPGMTSHMKTMISYGLTHKAGLLATGWGLTTGNHEAVWDKTSKMFSGKLPLKHIMGFAEDYTKGILNVKQELVLVIARTFKNAYVGECEAAIQLTKIEWKIKHIVPDDKNKLKLLNRINKQSLNARIKVPFRKWDLYELPSLRSTRSDVWAIKTTTSLERPRYVVIAFQDNNKVDNHTQHINDLSTADLNSVRLYLNNEVFPYERWNLDFDKKLYAAAYYAYEDFQRSYYEKDFVEPMMNIEDFRFNPMFVLDCSHQPDALKSSTVDIKLEFETRKNKFPDNTRVYALIIHDSCIAYNAFDGSVHSGLTYGF